MSEPIRVGLAGYSYGRTLHVPLIEQAGGVVAAIATSNPERVAQAREEHPDALVVADLDGLLATDVDVVTIATPTGLHLAHARAAIAAHKPFVLEKPVAITAAEARHIAEAAAEAGVPWCTFLNRRWDAGPLTARALAASGDLGEVHTLDFNWERWRPVPRQRWRETADWREGGGILLDLGPHLIDFALCLFGPAATVHAEINQRTTQADDEVFLSIRHTGGARSHLRMASTRAWPFPRLRVLGTRAGYVYHDDVEEREAYPSLNDADADHAGWITEGLDRRPAPRAPGGQADLYRGVFAALRSPAPAASMPVEPEAGVAVAEVIDAARVSTLEHRVVALHPET